MKKFAKRNLFMKLLSFTLILPLMGIMVLPHLQSIVFAANAPDTTWLDTFTETFSDSGNIQNVTHTSDTGAYQSTGGVDNDGYFIVKGTQYNGPAIFLDNRAGSSSKKFLVTAYIKAANAASMYQTVEMWGGNEFDDAAQKFAIFTTRRLSDEWQPMKAVVSVASGTFVEVRIKSLSDFGIDNVSLKPYEDSDDITTPPNPAEPDTTPAYEETYEMDTISLETGSGATVSGNTITYTSNWQRAIIKLDHEMDLSKYGSVTITGSASAKFRHSFFDKYKDNLKGSDAWISYNNAFEDKFVSTFAMTGRAKYLVIDSCDGGTLTLKIDSIKFSKKLVASEDAIKTNKDVGNNNPITTQRFTADPFAIEYDGRVYVYGTNDSQQLIPDENGQYSENTFSMITTLNCYSSDDMSNWTDHGVIKVAGKGEGVGGDWANNSWAPAVTYKKMKDGTTKFFLYFCNGGSGIGVLTADSPIGPWKDELGKLLIDRSVPNCSSEQVPWLFDPAVFVDDDGTGYLYFGGGVTSSASKTDAQNDAAVRNPKSARVVKLGEDMISLANDPVEIDAPYLFEDSGINKIGDTYYYSYCSNFLEWKVTGADGAERKGTLPSWTDHNGNSVGGGEIMYMTSDNPLGPFTKPVSILKNPGSFGFGGGNNHHCMLEVNDNLYMFYHAQKYKAQLGVSANGYRSSYVDVISTIKDGTGKVTGISPGAMTDKGVDSTGSKVNPYEINDAETFAWSIGTSTTACAIDSTNKFISKSAKINPETNRALSSINNGGWVGVSGVKFETGGAKKIVARVSSNTDTGKIKVYLDDRSKSSNLIATFDVSNTGGLDTYKEIEVALSNTPTGTHSLFFVYEGTGMQMDSWQFDKEAVTPTMTPAPTTVPTKTPTTVSVTGVSLNKKTLTLPFKGTYALKVSIAPSNATNQEVMWKSSKPTIAAVDSKGKVTAKKAGKTTITATTKDGNKIATCAVTIKKPTIKLNKKSLKLKVKQTNKKIKIKSSTPSGEKIKSAKINKKKIATVTVKKGKLTIKAKKAGKAVITITSTNGGTAKINLSTNKK